MLRVLAVLLALCGTAHSEEGGPGESKGKADAAQKSNQKGETAQQPPVPTGLPAPPIINIYTAKHAGEESHCTKPKDWKEWGSFVWCRSFEWIDAERIIAIWTVVLGFATCILGIATWRLWSATDRLVTGAEDTAERQLRAYVLVQPVTLYDFAEGRRLSADFTIRNVGQTPAYRVRAVADIDIFDHPLVDYQGELILPDPNAPIPTRALQPTGDFLCGGQMDRPLTALDVMQVLAGENRRVYLFGVVIYEDAFGEERRTKFCCYVGGREFARIVHLAQQQKSTAIKMPWDFAVLHNEST
jgi:hypothetical protein